jgi:hypothetical protein
MSTIKERVDELLTKPMNRRQFLKHAGLLVLAVVGVTNILNTLEPKQGETKQSASSGAPGYGASVYGGDKKPI